MDEKITALVEQAAEAILSGDIETANKVKEQIAALRDLYSILDAGGPAMEDAAKDLEAVAEEEAAPALKHKPAPVAKAVYRLPMGTGQSRETAQPADAQSWAIKRWYVQRFGETDAAFNQITRELYGTDDYPKLSYYKRLDFNRYLRTGVCDPQYERLLVLAPDQIMKAIVNGVPVTGNTSIKSTMIEALGELGGYLVPEDFNAEIISRLPGLTVVRPMADKKTTTRDRLTFLKRRGGTGRYIGNTRLSMTDESPTSSETETNALFGETSIPIHTCMASVPVSLNLFEDAATDLGSELQEEFSTAAAILEDEQFLVGSGVGMPQGVLNGTAASGAPFDSDITTITSGNASALTADVLRKAPFRLAGQYRQKGNASLGWVGASGTYEAIAGLKDGNGAYIWREMNNTGGVADGVPATLNGYAIKETEAMPAVAANTYPLIFGDWRGYRIVDRIGMAVKRYEDATTARQNQAVFVMRRRYGGQVVQGYRFVVVKIAT